MERPVNFHDEASIKANKIHNIFSDRHLMPELPSAKPPVAQLMPEKDLRRRLFAPKALCKEALPNLNRVLGHPQLSPSPAPFASERGTLSRQGRGRRAPPLLLLENKSIPARKTSLTLHLAALHEGPEGHRNFSGKAGGSEPRVPETFRLGEPGRVHPGREPLRDVASLRLRSSARTAGQEEWTSRIRKHRAGRLSKRHTNTSRGAPSAPRSLACREG